MGCEHPIDNFWPCTLEWDLNSGATHYETGEVK